MFGETFTTDWIEIWEEDEKDAGYSFMKNSAIASWCDEMRICYITAHIDRLLSPSIREIRICADYKEALEWAKVRCKELLEQGTKKEEE